MILYRCDACGKYVEDPSQGCSDDCAYLNKWSTPGILLTRDEAESIVRELKHSYISHENPLAHAVYSKLETFVRAQQMDLLNELDR